MTIRVRVNPAKTGEHVIFADPEDPSTPWLGQAATGRYMGWFAEYEVADWPEFEVALDLGADGRQGGGTPDPERTGSP